MKYIFTFFILIFFSCDPGTKNILVQNTGQTQGTFYHIQYISEGGKSYKTQIDSLLSEVDSSLSTYKEYSLISRLNKGEEIKVDKMFSDVFYAANKVFSKSGGLFDCSIAPLSNYWGFGFEDNLSEIDSSEVKR